MRIPVLGSILRSAMRRWLPSTTSTVDVWSTDPDTLVSGTEFLYRPGELLVNSPKGLDAVRGRQPTASHTGPIAGFWRVTWPSSGFDSLDMRSIVRAAMPGVAVEVNHVLTFEPRYSFKPDGPPFPTSETVDSPAVSDQAITVVVIDTGLPDDARTNHDVLKARATAVDDPLYVDGQITDEVGGHGTVVAARVLERSGRASVVSRSCAHRDGFSDEWSVAVELDAAITTDRPIVVNLSVGGYTSDDAGLPVLHRLVPKSDWPVVVAAAGNEGSSRQFFPAAFDHVVGVAALDAKQQRARFSNHGGWVDACAVGTGVVAPFISGWVRWSGTSFAAPLVAAAIADRHSATADPHETVDDVLVDSGESIEGCGRVVR